MGEYTVKLDILYTASVTISAANEIEARVLALAKAKRDQVDKDYCETSVVAVFHEATSTTGGE